MGIGGVKREVEYASVIRVSAGSLVALALVFDGVRTFQSAPHQQGPTIAQGGMRITSSITQGGTTHFKNYRHMAHHYRHMAPYVAVGCRRRAHAFAWPCRWPMPTCRQAPSSAARAYQAALARRMWVPTRAATSAAIRPPRQPVVRALHEHGASGVRLSRHRLGSGALVCQFTVIVCRDRKSAPSR